MYSLVFTCGFQVLVAYQLFIYFFEGWSIIDIILKYKKAFKYIIVRIIVVFFVYV